mmetsp:Transcript_104159/g.335894  ORF Transcript_104159/g.335894 Transcript_104159/m.335894 type:complete len:451 (-) Transcript_104159:59-1411(-)
MFRSSVMVFHVPGHLMEPGARGELEGLMQDIALCAVLGVLPVLVLSLEPRVLERLRAEGRELPRAPESGQLLVDRDVMQLAKQEAGVAFAEVEAAFARRDGLAPFSVYSSSQLFTTLPRRAQDGLGQSLLGRVHRVDVAQVQRRLDDGNIVCLTSLGMGTAGEVRYVPSDELAAEVAKQLKATKLIFFTRGQRIVDTRHRSLVPSLQMKDAKAFVEHAGAHGHLYDDRDSAELLRYLELLLQALSSGTRRGHLIDPARGALLQELYTTDGSGTLISQDLYDGIRLADSSDVASIQELIEPLAKKGLLRRRSGYEIECACNNREMFVWKRDGTTMGCASLQRAADAAEKAELGCFVVSPHCRGKGHGAVLLSYVERVALLQGLRMVFLLTTQTMQWFVERGFAAGSLEDLPPAKRASYDRGRSSRIYVKHLDSLPSELHERLTFVEVDGLD